MNARATFHEVLPLVLAAALIQNIIGENAPSPSPLNLNIRAWGTEKGLPSNTVRAILQTRDGYLWAATPNGLARFDGVRFLIFNRANTPGLSSDDCFSLAEDVAGNL